MPASFIDRLAAPPGGLRAPRRRSPETRPRARRLAAGSDSSPRIRRLATRSGPVAKSRHGSIRPAPAQATRAAFSAMSPTCGQHSTGTPAANARATVPCPPWQITREACGITCEYESQSTTTAFPGAAGTGAGSSRFVVATTRTGSSASASRAVRTSRSSGSCAVLGATSTSGSIPLRQLDVRIRQLELHRPRHIHAGRPPPRILQLRERGDHRQLAADPAVKALNRR